MECGSRGVGNDNGAAWREANKKHHSLRCCIKTYHTRVESQPRKVIILNGPQWLRTIFPRFSGYFEFSAKPKGKRIKAWLSTNVFCALYGRANRSLLSPHIPIYQAPTKFNIVKVCLYIPEKVPYGIINGEYLQFKRKRKCLAMKCYYIPRVWYHKIVKEKKYRLTQMGKSIWKEPFLSAPEAKITKIDNFAWKFILTFPFIFYGFTIQVDSIRIWAFYHLIFHHFPRWFFNVRMS